MIFVDIEVVVLGENVLVETDAVYPAGTGREVVFLSREPGRFFPEPCVVYVAMVGLELQLSSHEEIVSSKLSEDIVGA